MIEIVDMLSKFFDAEREAEKKGEHYFTCPLCDGQAHWSRISGHLHAACKSCGFRMAE